MDNYDEPKSRLTGNIVFDGQAIGVRTDGTGLSLWQDGYDFKREIPVFIAQDGSYSAILFDGEYQMTRKGGAPWEEQRGDTIRIRVKGNTKYDIPVNPYFVIRNDNFSKQGGAITATFTVQKGVEAAALSEVSLFLGKTILLDDKKHESLTRCDLSTITLGQEVTVTATIPTGLANAEYLFARVGVRSTSSGEFSYTQVKKIALK